MHRSELINTSSHAAHGTYTASPPSAFCFYVLGGWQRFACALTIPREGKIGRFMVKRQERKEKEGEKKSKEAVSRGKVSAEERETV